MLHGLIVLFSFLLAGEFVAHLFALPVPGSVLGMLLLFTVLVVRGKVSDQLKHSSDGLLPYLPLFIVPASVGIVNYMGLLQQEGWKIALAIIISLMVGLPACGLLAQFFIKAKVKRTRGNT